MNMNINMNIKKKQLIIKNKIYKYLHFIINDSFRINLFYFKIFKIQFKCIFKLLKVKRDLFHQ